jgi:hypothetical protein
LRSVLSRGTNGVGIALLLPEDGVLSSYLEFWTMDKVRKSSDFEKKDIFFLL